MAVTVERDVGLMHVAGSGVAWSTDKGVAAPPAPSDPVQVPGPSWLPLGAVTEEGLTQAFEQESEDVRVWGLLPAFRTLVTSTTRTFALQLRETQRDVCVSLMYQRPIEELSRNDAGVRAFADAAYPAPDRRAFLFKALDGNTVQQFYVPLGEVTERENVQHQPTDSSFFGLTISCYPDAAGNTIYLADNAPASPPVGGGS